MQQTQRYLNVTDEELRKGLNELRLEVQRGWRRGDLVKSFAELVASDREAVHGRAFGEHGYSMYVKDALIS